PKYCPRRRARAARAASALSSASRRTRMPFARGSATLGRQLHDAAGRRSPLEQRQRGEPGRRAGRAPRCDADPPHRVAFAYPVDMLTVMYENDMPTADELEQVAGSLLTDGCLAP